MLNKAGKSDSMSNTTTFVAPEYLTVFCFQHPVMIKSDLGILHHNLVCNLKSQKSQTLAEKQDRDAATDHNKCSLINL